MARLVRISLEGTGEIQPDGSMRVIGVLAPIPELEAPNPVVNLQPIQITEALVSLAWEDGGGGATSWKVLRDSVELDEISVRTFEDDTVAQDTEYEYAVVAVNAAGESAELSIEVRTLDVAAVPAVPTGLNDTSISAYSVELQWNPQTDATEWDVHRDTVFLATVQTPVYSDSTVEPDTTYDYQVLARNLEGDSALCTAHQVTTSENSPPEWVALPQSGEVGVGFSLNLNVLCEDPEGRPIAYSILDALPDGLILSGAQIGGTPTTPGDTSVGIRADDGDATADVTLDFAIAAAPDTTAPSTPENFLAVADGSTVTCTWDPSSDASGIASYEVQRSGDGGQVWTVRGNPQGPPFVESGVPNGERIYRVRARDASTNANLSGFSNTSTVEIGVTPGAPDVPIDFVLTPVSASRIDGVCEAGPNGSAPTAYEFAIGTSQAGPFTVFQTSASPSFSRTGLTAGFYWFRVIAYTGVTPSAGSNIVGAPTLGFAQAADFEIEAGTTSWDGSVLRTPLTGGPARAVQAGDIIELEAGTYPRLTLSNIAPAANTVINRNTDYVTIRGPATGTATITASSGTGTLLNLNRLRFVKIDGESFTASPDVDGKRRNIRVVLTGTSQPTFLVRFGTTGSGYNHTRDIVMKHVEVAGNWSGTGINRCLIGIGTNGPFTAADFPTAWQENMIFEDMYIHNVQTEGIYIGSNTYKTVKPSPPPGREVPLRHIKIRRCRFLLCGGNAIDAKSWFGGQSGIDQFPLAYDVDTNNSVHDCQFFQCGTNDDPSANPPSSPTVSFLSCKAAFYSNEIESGGGAGLNCHISEGTDVDFPAGVSTTFRMHVFNNRIRACGAQLSRAAVTVKAPDMPAAFRPIVEIFGNTFISNNGPGVQFASTANSLSFARNNIVLDNDTPFEWGSVTNEAAKNLTAGALASVFVDVTGTLEAGTLDLRLLVARPVAGGSVLGTDVPTVDADGDSRVLASADMGAYEFT